MISDSYRKRLTAFILFVLVVLMAFVCLFVGSSHMSLADGIRALSRKSTAANNRIIWNIRLPRVLAALIAEQGLLSQA